MVTAALLPGCSRQSAIEQQFEQLNQRLARVLDVRASVPEKAKVLAYPSRRLISQPLQPVAIGILDYLSLSSCRLQRLVGERNSSLGRVMAESQRWIYEAQFIVAGRECIKTLLAQQKNPELLALLQQAIAVKETERDQVMWNASFGSKEFQQLFSRAQQPLLSGATRPGELISALASLRRQMVRWHKLDVPPGEDIEAWYQIIGADNWLGQLQASLIAINAGLEQGNELLQQRLDGRPLCFKQRSNRNGDAFNAVFLRYYIGQVQPYLAQVYQQGEPVLAELNRIYDLLATPSSELADYWQKTWSQENDGSLWLTFNHLVTQHTKLWQQQLSQCGLMPGSV